MSVDLSETRLAGNLPQVVRGSPANVEEWFNQVKLLQVS